MGTIGPILSWLHAGWSWLDQGKHGPSISAIGSIVSASFAFIAFFVALQSLRTAQRNARSSIEPWLELSPSNIKYEVKWDIQETELQIKLPETTEFAGTRGAFAGPAWPLGNIGGGPAVDVQAIWRFDDTLLTKSIVSAAEAVGKNLEVPEGQLLVVDKGLRGMPLAHIATRVQRHLAFVPAAKNESDFVSIEIPSYILNCVSLHVMSAADNSGVHAVGQIDLFIRYKNKFREQQDDKQFFLEYNGYPLWYEENGISIAIQDQQKRMLKGEIEIKLKQEPIKEPVLRSRWHEVGARVGVWKYLRHRKTERKRDLQKLNTALRELRERRARTPPDDSRP